MSAAEWLTSDEVTEMLARFKREDEEEECEQCGGTGWLYTVHGGEVVKEGCGSCDQGGRR